MIHWCVAGLIDMVNNRLASPGELNLRQLTGRGLPRGKEFSTRLQRARNLKHGAKGMMHTEKWLGTSLAREMYLGCLRCGRQRNWLFGYAWTASSSPTTTCKLSKRRSKAQLWLKLFGVHLQDSKDENIFFNQFAPNSSGD